MSEANKELVRCHFEEIWNRRNLAICDEIMAEDFLEHAAAPFTQSAPGRVNGPQAMRGSAEWLLAQFPDLHMTIEAMIAEGDTVAVRILSKGTNLGALNDVVPPTGKRFSARQSHCSGSRTASSSSTGPRARIFLPCCSWGSCSPRADRLHKGAVHTRRGQG